MATPLYKYLAGLFQSYNALRDAGNYELAEEYAEAIEDAVKEFMPSGSGINSGTQVDWRTTDTKMLFTFTYDHISDGQYVKHTGHGVFVYPSFTKDFILRISGRLDHDLEDYLIQTFEQALRAEVSMPPVVTPKE